MPPYARIAWLASLYLVQGLPFGFQANALAVLLRQQGISLTHIALTSALALPWSFKALWAPFVDKHWSASVGKRRSWILPMQALLILAMVISAFLPLSEGVTPILVLVLLMNLFAATMDIAVDGLAVDVLRASELGIGNATQVVGYKIGMLMGGGLLVWASARFGLGWSGIFFLMATVVGVVLVTSLFMREEKHAQIGNLEGASSNSEHASSHSEQLTITVIVGRLREALTTPTAGWVIALLATYKLGESLVDPVFQPVLLDQGMEAAEIGLIVGTFGMVASIAGSLGGGFLATRGSPLNALGYVAVLRVLAIFGQWLIASFGPFAQGWVALATCAEHLASGALTTIMFAFMMERVDKRIGATHYTVLATLEVLGKAPLSLSAGYLAETLGVRVSFGMAVFFAAMWIVLHRIATPRLRVSEESARAMVSAR
jgi:MFS family permease